VNSLSRIRLALERARRLRASALASVKSRLRDGLYLAASNPASPHSRIRCDSVGRWTTASASPSDHVARVLAIQPDSTQACTVRPALLAWANVEVVVVDSLEAALTAIEQQVPDLILLHTFMPPGDEDDLIAYLRTFPHADHVQPIRLPLMESSSDRQYPMRRLVGILKPRSGTGPAGCDPRLFAADVASYLSRVHSIRKEIEARKAGEEPLRTLERRGARRWSPVEVPCVSMVRLVEEWVDLINVSSGGALVRTYVRPAPETLKRLDAGPGPRPRATLTFELASGGAVRAAGQVVRCRVGPIGSGRVAYEVAFRFDESVDLGVPIGPPLAVEADGHDTNATALECVAKPDSLARRHPDSAGHTILREPRFLAGLPRSTARRV
jgi:CheY-like chemotaxis protein